MSDVKGRFPLLPKLVVSLFISYNLSLPLQNAAWWEKELTSTSLAPLSRPPIRSGLFVRAAFKQIN